MPKRNGIDVAHYQGTIDWRKVAGSGVTWAGMKATQGTTFRDPTFTRNRLASRDAGVRHRLFYHWLNPAPLLVRLIPAARRADAQRQAAHFLATVGTLHTGEGVMLDAEQDGIRADQTAAWCEAVERATGRPVAVYTGAFVAGGEVWRSREVFNGLRPRVFAAYTSETKARQYAAPHQWDVWQWTGKGVVPGVGPLCDIDQVDRPERFELVCGYGTTPAPQPPTTGDDDMAQLIKVNDGDTAIFLTTGGIARHVDRDALNELQFVGQAPKTAPVLVPRGFLGSLLLAGSLPPDTTTHRSDFGGEA